MSSYCRASRTSALLALPEGLVERLRPRATRNDPVPTPLKNPFCRLEDPWVVIDEEHGLALGSATRRSVVHNQST